MSLCKFQFKKKKNHVRTKEHAFSTSFIQVNTYEESMKPKPILWYFKAMRQTVQMINKSKY